MSEENRNECDCIQAEKGLRVKDEPETFKRDTEREKGEGQDQDQGGIESMLYKHGSFVVFNRSGQTFKKLYVRHRRGNAESASADATFHNLETGDSTISVDFVYLTGNFSPYDYWFIDLELPAGWKYKNKDNFYCSVRCYDNGVVAITIDADLIAGFSFSNSSGCKTNLRGPY